MKVLGVVLKYWAKVIPVLCTFPYPIGHSLYPQLCQLNAQELGAYPSQMFVLMLIHFLQQRSPPVLPIPPKVGVATVFLN